MTETSSHFGRWLSSPPEGEEVVISGISGRFPNSKNVREFQENLFNKVDLVSDDSRRWNLNHPEIPQRNAKIYDINKLDAGYFGLHHRQADIMDPTTRKFLEVATEAIIDAGINPSDLEGTKTAVFVGACYSDMEVETLSNITKPQSFGITGYLRSLMANRISYFLKLKGPSCILDTACSSSLNALELAFKTLRTGQCDSAIVGGVNLLLHPGVTRQFFRLGVLSSDGTCKVFDESANGYVRGETICAIFLQKSKDAKRIYGQIVYTKVNCDGFKPLGITFPSTQMQKELMTEIFSDSSISASALSFMEAHGTGTEVGDPQEVEAIDAAIARKRDSPLLIGSVKCTVGHTEPSSGFCSLAKVIIAMETGFIAPNIHLKNIKKGMLGFEEGRLVPVLELTELQKEDALIGINNFGFGGNNCHLLVKRFSRTKSNKGLPDDDLARLVCVSARSSEGVESLLNDLMERSLDREYVGLLHEVFRKEVKGHLHRGFAVLSKTGVVCSGTKAYPKQNPFLVVFGKFEKGYSTLSKFLMDFPIFRNTIKSFNDILEKKIDLQKTISKNQIESDVLCSFAVQIGLIEVLKLLKLEPTSIYGDSYGKLIAAYYYDEISLEQAIKSICSMIEATKSATFENLITKLDKNNFRKDSTNGYNILSQMPKDSLILNISDVDLCSENVISFTQNGVVNFFKTLGRIYLEGYDLQVQNLYPPVAFPVSRGTPMISPVLKWDYGKSWYTYRFGEFMGKDVTQKEHNVSPVIYEEDKYLSGHVIDGRNLMPATGYLHLVWKTFLQSYKLSEVDNLPIIFEDCRFVRAVTLHKKEAVRLLVSIQKKSGYFEVLEKDAIIVTGRIYTTDDITKHMTDLPKKAMPEERSQFLEQDEIYRELYLRGYNYSGLFKGIGRCSTDASVAQIKWDTNWVSFLDTLLQLKIMQIDTRSLYVPTGIKKLVINPLKHEVFAETQKDSLCIVHNYKDCNVIKCGEVEIAGIKATAIAKRKSQVSPVLEKYVFVPNETQLDIETSVRVNAQIVLENSLENNFKAVEIIDDAAEPEARLLLPIFAKALDDMPLVMLNLIVSSKNEIELPEYIKVENFAFTSTSNLLLIVGTSLLPRSSLLNQTLSALSPEGYLLSREKLDSVLESNSNIEIITEHRTETERLILLKKTISPKPTNFIQVNSKSFTWLPELQKAIKSENDVVVYSQNLNQDGTLGLINCLRREPGGRKIKCIYDMVHKGTINIEDALYQPQLKKQLAFSVFKDGVWGTYRHLLLEPIQEVECEHIFAHNIVRGDLSSLKWIKGPITHENTSKVFYPCYVGLNFKDVMIASGRVSLDLLKGSRSIQEFPLGFEFSGFDSKGKKIFGMVDSKGLATMIRPEHMITCEIPPNWTLEEASTIFVVYATVITAIVQLANPKPGQSILIHSGTGGIGLAALNICQHLKLNIFVTVGTEEKRDYLRKHYPDIPESHIGNSRDTSFEEMIKRETKGQGVNILLNSLTDEKLKASVRCMAHNGHFLEIGKVDLGNDVQVETIFLERNVAYHGVMLDQIFNFPPDFNTAMYYELKKGIQEGYIKPLPSTLFQKDQLIDAFKYMTTGKHIGKVVLKIRDEKEQISDTPQFFKGLPRFQCDLDKSYIIIGGLGGFGIELIDWLYLRGAKNVVVVSRSGIQSGYQRQRLNNWKSSGIDVHISTKDVTTKQGCLELIKEASKIAPIHAIFNLAVVLKDALFEDQTIETFETSLAPKAQATIHLDEISRKYCPDLKYFVIFSSVSCGRGNPGQTNYGTANSIMERICEKRKEDGFPALAIQWGAIGDVGLVAKMQKENKELVIGGTLQQKISSCLDVLDELLNQNHPVVASMVVAEKIDKTGGSGSAVEAVAYILGIKDIKSVSPHTTFAELGIDSMMGIEMLQILEKDFEIYITAKDLRNLTFARLIDLENEKKEGRKEKIEDGKNLLLKFFPTNYSNEPVVKIPSLVKDEEEAPTVFLFPGAEGIFENLTKLTGSLKAHIFGIQYNSDIEQDSIVALAETILPHLEKTVTKDKPFFIIAYSFGAAVATELTKILEQKGFSGSLILIEGSPTYLINSARESFPEVAENELQTAVLFRVIASAFPIEPFESQKKKYLSFETFDERIELAMNQIPSSFIKDRELQKRAVIGLYNRYKAVIKFKFSETKIKSNVYLFRAKSPMLANFAEDYNLSELCEKPITNILLEGDHTTILDQQQLIDEIQNLFLM